MNTSKRHSPNERELDRNTAERMFAGLAADDAPPEYAAVAAVLTAIAAPVDGSSVAPGESAALRAYRDAAYAAPSTLPKRRLRPWYTAASSVAAFAAAGALAIGGGVAAAATGSLPAPAQRVAHQILGGLGVPAAVTPDVIPADLVDPSGEAGPSSAPGSSVSQLARTTEDATTETEPEETPTSPAPAAATSENDHGEAVSAVAQSAAPGPGHGLAVCAVASAGACPTDNPVEPRATTEPGSDNGMVHSASGDHGDQGAENSAERNQANNSASENPAVADQSDGNSVANDQRDGSTAAERGLARASSVAAPRHTPTPLG